MDGQEFLEDQMLPIPKGPIRLQSMFGIGDCIFHLAIIRELVSKYGVKLSDITLETPYVSMYHDLVERGMKLAFVPRAYTQYLEPDAMRSMPKSGPTPRT